MTQETTTPAPWFSYPAAMRRRLKTYFKGLDYRHHRVLKMEHLPGKDGEDRNIYTDVQFVDPKTGEVVVGIFKLIGWGWEPSAERAKTNAMLSSPPLVVAGGRKQT